MDRCATPPTSMMMPAGSAPNNNHLALCDMGGFVWDRACAMSVAPASGFTTRETPRGRSTEAMSCRPLPLPHRQQNICSKGLPSCWFRTAVMHGAAAASTAERAHWPTVHWQFSSRSRGSSWEKLSRPTRTPRGKNCPWAQYSENNSAARATIHKRIDVCERPRRELLHTPIRL